MGGMGTSTASQDQTQNITQQSQTAPWLPAQPAISGILGQIGAGLTQTGMTHPEDAALANIQTNAANYGGFYAPEVSGVAQRLLAGGGAANEAGNVNQNYARYIAQTNPLASNTNYDPYKTPGFSDAMRTLTDDITGRVNGSFAGAGRDFSGANSRALGRGIAEGVAPSIVGQYNQNVNNQRGAADALYGAGNTNAGILAGMQQHELANRQLGAGAATQALDLQNAGANATLQAEAARRGIPVQALGLLAQIGIPIAGLGRQASGTSDSIGHATGSKTASPLEQFGQLTSGLTGMFGTGGGTSTLGNIFKFFS